MNPTQEAAKSIFLEALHQPVEDRAAYLNTACGEDVELRRKVEALLASHQQQDSFLDPRKLHPGSGHTQTSDFDSTATSPGKPRQHPSNPLAPWLTPSTQPNSLGRLRHYEVLEELGQGGFGIVYRVFDEKLHRMVALKVLSPTLASNPSARARFLREARAAAAVRHEHVISIHDVEDEPIPHLVMEYINGQTLQQKIDKTGQLQLKEILRIGMQMAQGLAAAHKQGLIHRDIKPSNILLENGIERVKISDFGLARAVDDSSISHQGLIVGTPAYMSPEQADGKLVDARSDLFSLGSTLYAMCTGNSPFTADSTLATLKKVTERNPDPVSVVNPELPNWLDGIVSNLMAKQPDKRYQSAHEVADELAAKLAMVQSPSTVIPPSRSRTWWVVASTILIVGIILLFTERWGLTKLTPPIIKLFHHQLTLELPSKDTIVELWMTDDKVDNFPKSMQRKSFGKYEPFITVVNTTKQTVILPPGNYWLLARLQGLAIDRRLLTIGWGGSDTITPSANPTNKVTPTKETLLKRYDPKHDRPTGLLVKLAVKENDKVFHWESTDKDRGISVSFDPILEKLPRDGVIACRCKVRITKRHKDCWGDMLLDTWGPDHYAYEWPRLKYHFYEESPDFLAREVRYPAHAFHQKSPAQLTVRFGLYAPGTIEVTDLELWHLPSQAPPVTERTAQLEQLVKLAWEAKDVATKRYESGLASHDHAMLATIKWWEAQLELARDRQNPLEVRDCLKQILDQQEARVGFAQKLIEAGALIESALISLKEDVLNTKQRIMELK